MSANLRAFLAVIRHCEGTSGPNGYRTIVGGELFDSFADHPRRLRTGVFHNGTPWQSTAAGAYQFLARTWDECSRALGLPDFSPESQDRAAIYLIQRRGALRAVEDGDLRRALELCNREWASLPGSPYGQPTHSYAVCERVFVAAGGTLSQTTDTPSAPAVDISPHTEVHPSIAEDNHMPLPAAAAVALGAELLKLLPMFSSGSRTAERNVGAVQAIAPKLIEIARDVTGASAPNEQAAVEAVTRDHQLRDQFIARAVAQWSDLAPAWDAEERSREAARGFSERLTASGPEWRQIGVGFVVGTLSLVIVIGGGMLFWNMLESPQLDPGQKGLILGALLTAFTSAISFWFGSSATSRQKDITISEQARR